MSASIFDRRIGNVMAHTGAAQFLEQMFPSDVPSISEATHLQRRDRKPHIELERSLIKIAVFGGSFS
jgi:hypothetical protein